MMMTGQIGHVHSAQVAVWNSYFLVAVAYSPLLWIQQTLVLVALLFCSASLCWDASLLISQRENVGWSEETCLVVIGWGNIFYIYIKRSHIQDWKWSIPKPDATENVSFLGELCEVQMKTDVQSCFLHLGNIAKIKSLPHRFSNINPVTFPSWCRRNPSQCATAWIWLLLNVKIMLWPKMIKSAWATNLRFQKWVEVFLFICKGV